MTTGPIAIQMALACKHCGERPPADSVLEAFQLHMQVEHDTDALEMDLVAVCTCGATMDLERTAPTGGGEWHYFRCPACGNHGRIKQEDHA